MNAKIAQNHVGTTADHAAKSGGGAGGGADGGQNVSFIFVFKLPVSTGNTEHVSCYEPSYALQIERGR